MKALIILTGFILFLACEKQPGPEYNVTSLNGSWYCETDSTQYWFYNSFMFVSKGQEHFTYDYTILRNMLIVSTPQDYKAYYILSLSDTSLILLNDKQYYFKKIHE